MSVQSGPTFKRYAANGVTTVYAIPFLLLDAADLLVTLDGVEVVSGFVLTGVGNPSSTCTFSAAPTGDLLFQLSISFQRLADYQNNGDLLSSTLNNDLDRLWLAIKQLDVGNNRALAVGVLEPEGIPALPVVAARALKMLAFDASSNPIASNLTLAQLEEQPALALASAQSASLSATAASNSKDSADASAILANEWATEAEDTPVTSGLFSAYHWARKALASAMAAADALLGASSIRGNVLNMRITTTGLSGVVTINADQVVVENLTTPGQFKTLFAVARSPTLNISSLDTGASVLPLTWYHLWLFWNSSLNTQTARFSLSATTPVIPAGFTHGVRLNAVRTDNSVNRYPLSQTTDGKRSDWKPVAGSNTLNLPILSTGATGSPTTPTWTAVAIAPSAPPTAKQLRGFIAANSAVGVVMAAPNSAYGAWNSLTNPPPCSTSGGGGVNRCPFDFVLESTSIHLASSDASSGLLVVTGWDE